MTTSIKQLQGPDFVATRTRKKGLAASGQLRSADTSQAAQSIPFSQFLSLQDTLIATVQGLPSPTDQYTYAALTLQRLVGIFFLQHMGHLDHNPNYLFEKLQMMQQVSSTQISFHRHFLLRLFHEGVGTASPSPPETQQLLGAIPHINAKLYAPHPLEQRYPAVTIPDTSIEHCLRFFSTCTWSGVASSATTSSTITPDLLGVLFERSIDQHQHGAYYTQNDITCYIATQTILLALFQRLTQYHAPALQAGTDAWLLLQKQPEHYLRAPLQKAQPLPLETAYEYRIRQQRAHSITELLRAGHIHSIHDVITYNLDGQRLTHDMIATCNDSELLRAWYENLSSIRILDPACGSGAFLFAALDLLTLLYTTCLARMQFFLDQDGADPTKATDANICYFHQVLQQMAPSGDSRATLLTKIAHHNLYGVDIMQAAVDITQLRLLLKLASFTDDTQHLETLAQSMDTLRQGNALVGCLRSAEPHTILQGSTETFEARRRALDEQVAKRYNIDVASAPEEIYQQWYTSHQPFHWCLEFASIMQEGGFDAIIGNPPYIEYSQSKRYYTIEGYETTSCGNLYAAMIERVLALGRQENSYLGFIVPLSLCGGERFQGLRDNIMRQTEQLWLANFEIFPSRLFDEAFQRLSILFAGRGTRRTPERYVTRMQRWYSGERPFLIDLISYTPERLQLRPAIFPKLASPIQEQILQKILLKAQGASIADLLVRGQSPFSVYYQEATNYWTKASCRIPFYKKNGLAMSPPHSRQLFFKDQQTAWTTMAVLNSSLFYTWFASYSDGFHLAHALVKEFPLDLARSTAPLLAELGERLELDIQRHAQMSTRNTQKMSVSQHRIELEEYRMARSKWLLDEIDTVLASHYSFTQEELTFIINYDQKYRMGKEQGMDNTPSIPL